MIMDQDYCDNDSMITAQLVALVLLSFRAQMFMLAEKKNVSG